MPEIWGVSNRVVETRWSEEDHGFIATVPSLPGCSAYGYTEKDAVEETIDAIEAWKQACIAAGNPVPPEDWQP